MLTSHNITTVEEPWASGEEHLELLRGEVYEVPTMFDGLHGLAMCCLAARLDRYVEDGRRGQGFAGRAGFILARNPDTVLGPDLAIISEEKLSRLGSIDGFLPCVPDLVIEIDSMHDTIEGMANRVREFIGYGVKLLIVVDRNPDTVFGPSYAYDSKQRLPARDIPEFFLEMAPDLVAEILLPTVTSTRVEQGARIWLKAGVKVLLMIDAEAMIVRRYTSLDRIDVFDRHTNVDCSVAMAGWTLDTAELFDDIPFD